jgi:hypothetical protein
MLHRRLSGEAARARGEDGTENRESTKRQDLYNDSMADPASSAAGRRRGSWDGVNVFYFLMGCIENA